MSHFARSRCWRIGVCCLMLLCGVLTPAQAVGTVTVMGPFGGVYTIAWTSNASGAVSGNNFGTVRGEIKQIKFVPGSGGSQPTDLYDVTLVDADGLDVLGGLGANLSNATPLLITMINVWTLSPTDATRGAAFDLVVANAGNAKSGTVYLLVQ